MAGSKPSNTSLELSGGNYEGFTTTVKHDEYGLTFANFECLIPISTTH